MKKVLLFILVIAAFSLSGQAQRSIDLRLVNKAIHPQKARATLNDIAPNRAVYKVAGATTTTYRDSFTYDEYEYYLTSKQTMRRDNGAWVPIALYNYDYDYNNMPIEILKQQHIADGWVNEELTTLKYNDDDFMPLLSEELFEHWENNDWINVKKHQYNYDDGITILVRDWNGTSFENHYLYTIENDGTNGSILLQYWNGGAWMNQEKMDITYNDNEEISLSVTQQWVNEAWVNDEKVEYKYDAPYRLYKVVKTLWENGAWAANKVKTINYEYDWMGSSHALCESNYGGVEEQNTDIEMFYNDGDSYLYEEVNEVEMYYIDLTNVNEQPTTSTLVIAPNPASSFIEVNTEHFTRAELYNLAGQKVAVSATPRIALKGLASGTYIIKVYHNNGTTEAQRFVIE